MTGGRGRWIVVGVGGLLVLSLGALALARTVGPDAAVRWTATSAPLVAFTVGFTWWHRVRNHPPDRPAARHDTLGVANGLTIVRGWLFAAVAGVGTLVPVGTVAWLPAAGYGCGVALDLLDGAVARARDRTTLLGAKLDMAIDTLGFLVAPVVAVAWGRLPVWYLSLAAARYLFKAGRGWRRRRGKPVYDLPPSRVRRPLAALQMGFLTVALAPLVPTATVHAVAAAVLAPSLIVFGRDYLVVAGHLPGAPPEE
jgi:CDP-diacylglycerol--glycerol-3-phosphate 3-phosphatidyltransferase